MATRLNRLTATLEGILRGRSPELWQRSLDLIDTGRLASTSLARIHGAFIKCTVMSVSGAMIGIRQITITIRQQAIIRRAPTKANFGCFVVVAYSSTAVPAAQATASAQSTPLVGAGHPVSVWLQFLKPKDERYKCSLGDQQLTAF